MAGSSMARMGAMQLQLVCLACLVTGIASQGLLLMPATVNRELGNYWLRKLGASPGGLVYYSSMFQRNVAPGANVFVTLNGISSTESPIEAVSKMSSIRGMYLKQGVGGKIKVQSFYRLLRCEEDTCFAISRVVASALTDGNEPSSQPKDVLVLVKARMGVSNWLVNAPQSVVTEEVLANSEEKAYADDIYKLQLFYKVVRNPMPCSASAIQTLAGAVSEFNQLPGFACIIYSGTPIIVGVQNPSTINTIQELVISWDHCDGSLGLLYEMSSTSGPRIVRLIKEPGQVTLDVVMDLPYDLSCYDLYATPDIALQAAAIIQNQTFEGTVNLTLTAPASITALGFTGKCAPRQFASGYGNTVIGQSEGLVEGSADQQLNSAFLPYNSSTCVAMLGPNRVSITDVNFVEVQCAELYFGTEAQQLEGVVTFLGLDPDEQATVDHSEILQNACGDANDLSYNFPIQTVLPDVALDFEEAKNLLLSSAEVKLHLDAVATNAASILATQIALTSSGVVIAHLVGRSNYYRRIHASDKPARVIACLTTGVALTIFNIPNFAIVARSLENRQAVTYTRAPTLHQAQVSNFSGVVMIEGYAFVTVEGSSATAIIGLALYCATFVFGVYATWHEFGKIIKRRNEVVSRLGHGAVIEDEDLLVQWRNVDNVLHGSSKTDPKLKGEHNEWETAPEVELL